MVKKYEESSGRWEMFWLMNIPDDQFSEKKTVKD